MKRAYAGAIGALVASIITYPFDTRKMVAQMRGKTDISKLRDLYAGYMFELSGNAVAAYVYFDLYSKFSETLPVPVASLASASCSCLLKCPTDILKKNKQAQRNLALQRRPDLSPKNILTTFFFSLSKNAPKAALKYTIYEPFMKCMNGMEIHSAIAGALAGMISAILTNIIFFPIDTLKTRVMLKEDIPKNAKEYFQGLENAVFLSLVNNVVGHSILEFLTQ